MVSKKRHVFVLSLFCAAVFTESPGEGGGGWGEGGKGGILPIMAYMERFQPI